MANQVQIRVLSEVDAEVEWVVTGLQLTERFNQPYSLRVEMRTSDLAAEPARLVGSSVSVSLERGAQTREISGIVERVEDGGRDGEQHLLTTLFVVPALQALRYRRNTRIFSDISIKDVLVAVLEEALGGYGRGVDVGHLRGDYPAQEYTVQYRETDLDFVHRLMEEHGVSYRFEQGEGVETVVLFDEESAHTKLVSLDSQEGMLAMVQQDGGSDETEDMRRFTRVSQLRSTVARTTVFDWGAPAVTEDFENDEAPAGELPSGAATGPEREDYDHELAAKLGFRSAGLDPAAVQKQAMLQRSLHLRDAVLFAGESTAINMRPGARFELVDHSQGDLNGEYVVVRVEHGAGDLVLGKGGELAYCNLLECVPAGVRWVPERMTLRPRIFGVQTATVVGPGGEEIHTDDAGRVMVQFHWDRRKQYDERSSCYVRVVQPWAGDGWGFMFLPRVGMEVAVTFVDGDPDRPIITGALYNGANSPPYAEADKTKSTIKSNSSPGGGGFNELRFDDAVGLEEIYVHAQKDMREEVLNDLRVKVGNNHHGEVVGDQALKVHGNQDEIVTKSQSLAVGGHRKMIVDQGYEHVVNNGEKVTISGGASETVYGDREFEVHGGNKEQVNGNVMVKIMGHVNEEIDEGESRVVGGYLNERVEGDTVYTHKGNVSDHTGGYYSIFAKDGMSLKSPGGVRVVSPGGINVVDPTSTTVVNQSSSLCSLTSTSVIGVKSVISGVQFASYGFSAGRTLVKYDRVGLKVDNCNVSYKLRTALEFKSIEAELSSGKMSVGTFLWTIIQ
ncbi:type VI secretion system tip protein VgrG [Pseudenhygromyxa sp. WMMC2535]|uniref:type VI secretion system Vgr family protein n=1 Tax=Pseudenhygromyxa sp. WMMC2535 TaxID=2712867 RepID=UPI001551EF5C|nr:type VI secretion system tip protein TssI/VgrG [Pseudenhygromyxa sp. WMMC2535]NVB40142.1 type VI secretion system tip protein VgrG [Pseudenhygromyxa sp. WMMC2535]